MFTITDEQRSRLLRAVEAANICARICGDIADELDAAGVKQYEVLELALNAACDAHDIAQLFASKDFDAIQDKFDALGED